MRVSRRAATFFPLTTSYPFYRGLGAWQGSRWSSARPKAKGGVQEGERGKGIKERERVVGKARGTSTSLYLGEGPGWQMRSGPTPCRTRRAVREITGPL